MRSCVQDGNHQKQIAEFKDSLDLLLSSKYTKKYIANKLYEHVRNIFLVKMCFPFKSRVSLYGVYTPLYIVSVCFLLKCTNFLIKTLNRKMLPNSYGREQVKYSLSSHFHVWLFRVIELNVFQLTACRVNHSYRLPHSHLVGKRV